MRLPDHPAVLWAARLILAAVFLAAAWPKLLDPDAFAVAVRNYRLLPDPLCGLLAIVLPGVELVAAIALFVPRTRPAAELLLSAMLIVFILAAGSALVRGFDISCGCFGTEHARRLSGMLLVQDLGLLVLAWLLVRDSRRHRPGGA